MGRVTRTSSRMTLSRKDAMTIAVIGAGGFVGKALTARLRDDGERVLPIVRRPADVEGERAIDNLATADWRTLLTGCDSVVLAAARVHVMNETAADPLAEFRCVNVGGSLAVMRGAIAAGVRRFVFISTVKVNGEETVVGAPFTPDQVPQPTTPYGISKHEAEQALRVLAAEARIELAIVRPTLVYGPGVRANFESMMRWVARGIPLPLGGIERNRRSLVGIDNLVDLIVLCLRSPAAAGETFMASDGDDLSTTRLLREVGRALDRAARLLPIPAGVLDLGAVLIGKDEAMRRLTGSLQVDIVKNRDLLGWTPPISVAEGLARTASAFLRARAN